MSSPASVSAQPSVLIAGLGTYIPRKILTNAELSTMMDTSDEWIRTRSGIRERRIASDAESPSFMATAAAKSAIKDAGLQVGDIDLILTASMSPDMSFPSLSCLIQHQLKLPCIPAFDVVAACTGFLYGLEVGKSMLLAGNYQNALVIGTEKMSAILDWEDRSTCVLFGDGAGAAVLSKSSLEAQGLIGSHLAADGAGAHLLKMPAGGTACPISEQSLRDRQHFLKMNGKEIFKLAVKKMHQSIKELLAAHQLQASDIDHYVPHQANIRIIEALAERLGVPAERFFANIETYGNTSAASIPIALEQARDTLGFKTGDYILLTGFGAGLTWGSVLLKWTLPSP